MTISKLDPGLLDTVLEIQVLARQERQTDENAKKKGISLSSAEIGEKSRERRSNYFSLKNQQLDAFAMIGGKTGEKT